MISQWQNLKAESAKRLRVQGMEASRRLSSWLRLASALVLALGLSSAAAVAAANDGAPVRDSLAASHAGVIATALPTAALHTGTVITHAVHKHRLPAMASGIAAAALALTGLVSMAVRRRHADPAPRQHALTDGARAPPAASDA